MTDIPAEETIPARRGTAISIEDEHFVVHLMPCAQTCVHGLVRASVVSFIVDVIGAMEIDTDLDAWTFTSELSLRLPARRPPERIDARNEVLRRGSRSITSRVSLSGSDGEEFGSAMIGFVRIPRRPQDPPKFEIDPLVASEIWGRNEPIGAPLREAAGIVAVDPSTGRIMMPVLPELKNPAGALQGAIVALGIEAAAEDLAEHHLGGRQVVTDIDMRFLGQGRVGPIVGRAWFVGAPTEGTIEVELVDVGQDGKRVAVGYTRVHPAPSD